MKSSILLVLALLPGLACGSDANKTPMAQVVKLIQGLRAEVVTDGKKEQEAFDKYACWCEKTMERKAKDISDGKDLAAETQTLIKKLKGEIASHGAEITQLKKDLAQNSEAQKDATALREKENGAYSGERTESEQCIGALEAAIKVLSGAGTKKGSFMQGNGDLQAAEIMSVIAGVRRALNHKIISQSLSDTDIDTMRHFVSKPDDFVGKHTKGVSAAQTGQNPFGDYAPQSTQITGILQGMYDAMTADLEKDNADEGEAEKSFQELMATKKEEQATLEDTLQKQESDMASKNKRLAESEVLLDDTNTDVENDEAFFDETKEACQTKATEWSVRTRLRTEELNGFDTAIKILSGGKKTFESSTSTFLQIVSVHKQTERSSDRKKAYDKLRIIAAQLRSRSVAKIAVEVQSGGHFDKVIAMIDEMIAVLRKEEADDIAHRDRCENSANANKNQLADLDSNIKKTQKAINRMGNTKGELEKDIANLEGQIKDTKKDMSDLLDFRNKEEAQFKKALKDDMEAAGLLRQAIAALAKFYKDNKIDVPALVQKKAPEYAKDADKAPDASSFSSDYGGRSSESGGILAILEMLVEDTEKEIKEGKADNADAQAKYLKQNGALQDALDGQNDAKAATEQEKADLEEKIRAYEKHRDGKKEDQKAEKDTEKAVGTDCAWVKTHFQDRRDKRKTEIQGLVDAKGFLAGVAAGDDPLPLM